MRQTYQFFHIFACFGFTAATPARLLDVRFVPKADIPEAIVGAEGGQALSERANDAIKLSWFAPFSGRHVALTSLASVNFEIS